ncbi:protease modulator HflC [Anaerofilum sp. BX8]|uniref:Protein HflC n=1 Tax=Anaerofilum hominis TaxID=2763016 RepID=A0A923L1F8_9FIRM|nr:protease modulator HflC [Anaerofilum hominis]MBC5581917.1 protease modulator HflC [Anaerofilum hominis]
MKRSKKIGVTLAAVLVLIVMALSSACVVTQQNEYTVVRQFGEVVDIRGTAGVSLKIPLIQTASTLPNTVLLYDLPISDVITQDKKTMVADSFVLWKIEDPKLFIQTLNGSISNAESRLSTIVYNSMKNIISSRTQSDVISGRDGELAADIRDGVGDTLSQYGIQLIAVETKHLDLPDDNKEAVYQRMISERNNIAASYTAQGESDAQKIRSETDREVQVMLSEAEAQAEMLIAEGEAEYMNILSDAYSDPAKADFYSFVRALDAAKASLSGGGDTLFLSKDSPLAQIFYSGQ